MEKKLIIATALFISGIGIGALSYRLSVPSEKQRSDKAYHDAFVELFKIAMRENKKPDTDEVAKIMMQDGYKNWEGVEIFLQAKRDANYNGTS